MGMIRPLAAFLLLAALAPVSPAAYDLTGLLGLDPAGAQERLGAPAEIRSWRGDSPEEDNVLFYYADHLYLFWFRNRVWQVRLDGRSGDSFRNLTMGMTRADVLIQWGSPPYEVEGSWIYDLEDRGWPVRARLFFDDDTLSDLYVYRSDW